MENGSKKIFWCLPGYSLRKLHRIQESPPTFYVFPYAKTQYNDYYILLILHRGISLWRLLNIAVTAKGTYCDSGNLITPMPQYSNEYLLISIWKSLI